MLIIWRRHLRQMTRPTRLGKTNVLSIFADLPSMYHTMLGVRFEVKLETERAVTFLYDVASFVEVVTGCQPTMSWRCQFKSVREVGLLAPPYARKIRAGHYRL